MSVQTDSPAVAVARAYVEAWSNHDFDAARHLLADDVEVTVTAADPAFPQTHLTGADSYVEGLIAYAQPIVPGSVRVLASTGDQHHALLTLTMTMAGGPLALRPGTGWWPPGTARSAPTRVPRTRPVPARPTAECPAGRPRRLAPSRGTGSSAPAAHAGTGR